MVQLKGVHDVDVGQVAAISITPSSSTSSSATSSTSTPTSTKLLLILLLSSRARPQPPQPSIARANLHRAKVKGGVEAKEADQQLAHRLLVLRAPGNLGGVAAKVAPPVVDDLPPGAWQGIVQPDKVIDRREQGVGAAGLEEEEQEVAESVAAEGVRAVEEGLRLGPVAEEDVEEVEARFEAAEEAQEAGVGDAEGVVGVQVALEHRADGVGSSVLKINLK